MTLADQENNKDGNVATQDQGQDQKDQKQDQTPPEPPEKKSRRRVIIIAVVILLLVAGGLFYWHSTFSEDTDDAQVDGDLFQVSSRVTGQVIQVYVKDNESVQAGQAIADIDPKDYQVAFEQAEANLASAEADYTQAHVTVPITNVTSTTTISNAGSDVTSSSAGVAQAEKQKEAADARVIQAKANALKAQLDVERYTPLVQKDVISKQQYDQAVATAGADTAAVLESQADVIAAQETIRQAQQKVAQSRFTAQQAAKNGPEQVKAQEARANSMLATVKQQQAKLEQARLNLGYCHITAPTAGIISKKNVDIGANISIGAGSADGGSADQSLGDGELQRDATGKDEAGAGRQDRSGCPGRPEVLRQGNADWRSDGIASEPVPAGECNRQLCEGGATYSGADRLHEPRQRERRLRAASWLLGDAGSWSEVSQ